VTDPFLPHLVRPTRRRFGRILLLCAVLLAACSSADDPDKIVDPGPGPDPDPLPEFDFDTVVFRVSTLEAPGRERVRWIGTTDGPLPDSPEPTRWPWIGYGRAFRVQWRASSADLPIIATRYRVSQSDFGPWLPFDAGKGVWGQDDNYVFENMSTAEQLDGQSCEEGPDCAGLLRFPSGRHRMQVRALTEGRRELDLELGRLEFEVNYPPVAEVVHDASIAPDDPAASPVASWFLRDGSEHHVAVADGDTVPSGATLRLRVRGFDRLPGNTDTDSFCCDLLEDASGTEMRYQGSTTFYREDVRGVRDSLFTLFGSVASDSTYILPLGPFDYQAMFRAVDEHGRRGASVGFSIVAGYSPLAPASSLLQGSGVLLHPERDAAAGETAFARGERENLAWDSELHIWTQGQGTLTLSGTWFEIPLLLRGEPDPRVAEVSNQRSPDASPQSEGYSDHVRSFAYELVHQSDSGNDIAEGPGDRPERYLDADDFGTLDLEGEDAWRVFVPDLVFESPELFSPGTCPSEDFCAIGDWLRARLGEFEFRLRSKTTGLSSVFHQESPQPARDLLINLSSYGRVSPPTIGTVSVHLALTDDLGNLSGTWPPAP